MKFCNAPLDLYVFSFLCILFFFLCYSTLKMKNMLGLCIAGGIFSFIGVIKVLHVLWKVAVFTKVNFFTHVDLKTRFRKAGDWAVVTGASDGIGRAMALDLGRRGFHICLIARTAAKLQDAAREIESSYGVQTRAIAFDFLSAGEKEWTELFEKLDELSIGIVVNNVGVSYPFVNDFANVPLETDLPLLKVNIETNARMTKYILPHFREMKAGGLVFLSSFSALTPTPLMATYSGTKAFSLSFGTALHYELKECGIDVLTVTPNLVSSRLTQYNSDKRPDTSFLMVSPEPVARHSLDKLGAVCVTPGHRNHAVIEVLLKMVPRHLRSVLLLNVLKKERAEGLKRNKEKQVDHMVQR